MGTLPEIPPPRDYNLYSNSFMEHLVFCEHVLMKYGLDNKRSIQSCKKTFFIRYLDFQLKNVRLLYLLNFAMI